MKVLNVHQQVLTAKGQPYYETETDPKGRIVLEEGEPKYQWQLEKDDTPKMVPRAVGDLIVFALGLEDASIAYQERVARFVLAARIEDAMSKGQHLELRVKEKDEARIQAAAELIKTGPNAGMFCARIQQALEGAKSKANGKEAKE